jgi:hypothetical protein
MTKNHAKYRLNLSINVFKVVFIKMSPKEDKTIGTRRVQVFILNTSEKEGIIRATT